MPAIVNAYAANNGIADAMRSLADSLFGDQAKQALIRENVAKTRLEEERLRDQNESANAIPGLFQSRDYRGTIGQILRHTPTAGNIGGVALTGAGLDANGNVNDPRLATAALGAGHSIEGTVPGQNATIAERINIARMQAERAAETQRPRSIPLGRQAVSRRRSFRRASRSVSQASHSAKTKSLASTCQACSTT